MRWHGSADEIVDLDPLSVPNRNAFGSHTGSDSNCPSESYLDAAAHAHGG